MVWFMREKSNYSKTCVKQPLSKRPKMFFKTDYPLMQVKSFAKCSKRSILQHFQPSLNYHLSLRHLFCLFLSGSFTQVLLYDHYGKPTFSIVLFNIFILLIHHPPPNIFSSCQVASPFCMLGSKDSNSCKDKMNN